MRQAGSEFARLSPLGQVAWAVYALEDGIYCLDPEEEGWTFFFQMLWSFDRIGHDSYREELLLGITPQYLLEAPYCVEEYVDPPRAHCYTKAEFHRYSQDEWLELSGGGLTARLPQNEFGYLHPNLEQKSFLGISQKTYDRLYALYRRCPARCREMADSVLLEISDFILDVLEHGRGEAEGLRQAVDGQGLSPPPCAPFSVYRRPLLEVRPDLFFLGRPCSRQELNPPHLFV